MISPHAKTTIVKPLREKNDFGMLKKYNGSSVYPFKRDKENIGIYGKQNDPFKCLNEDKTNKFLKINSVYSKLHAELEEIQKWKTLIEVESKEKNKKIEELTRSIEEHRKIAVNYQLENENLNLQLVEEMQQRSFVSEKLHATKEMYSALIKHFNTLQGHFEYRNRIEEMIKAADNKRCGDIENLKDKFNKMQLEQTDRLEYLNCALEDEANKLLDVRERYEQRLGEAEQEREALCTMVRNSEKEIGNFEKQLDIERNKVQFLEKEKEKLKSDLIEMENSSKYYDTLLQEKEEKLKNIEVSNENKEKQLNFQSSLINDLQEKCKQLLETNVSLDTEASTVPSLKQAIEQLKSEIDDLKQRFKEEEDKNCELLYSLQNVKNENINLEQKINEEVMKLEAFKDLQVRYNELHESNASLLQEKAELEMKVNELISNLSEIEANKERLSMLCEEKSELIKSLKRDFEEKLACEENKASRVQSEYEQLLIKLEITEGSLANNSKTFAEMEEKIQEVNSLRTDLSKTENELTRQKQSTYEVLQLLQDTEAKYNKDRLAKETEIIGYKGQIEKLDFETRMLKVEVEDLEQLKPENTQLKNTVEKLKLEISDLLSEKEELKKKSQEFGEKYVQTELDKSVIEKEQNAVVHRTEDYYKEEEIQKETAFSKMQNERMNGENTFVNKKHEQEGIGKKVSSSKNWDVDSSGSECLEFVYDERPKVCEKKVFDCKPKARDIDSSGSECLELVYDEKSHEAIGLSAPAARLQSGKNKTPLTPNDGPKLLPFKTKRKRDVQNVTQEDMVRKKFGLPPRNKIGNVQRSTALKPQLFKPVGKYQGFSNKKVTMEHSPWKSPAESSTSAQRKFFTKGIEERNTSKPPDARRPWF